MSLDGFIADEEGGYDWIVDEPEVDFQAYLAKIDTLLMGRGTYEVASSTAESRALLEGMTVVVVSTTLAADEHPDVTVVATDVVRRVAELKRSPGKDIWLFGGGVLFRFLLEADLVDRVEVGVLPVLLGQGIPILPGARQEARLALHSSQIFPSGMALLKYDVLRA
jgi:dihydrofolate reductase